MADTFSTLIFFFKCEFLTLKLQHRSIARLSCHDAPASKSASSVSVDSSETLRKN